MLRDTRYGYDPSGLSSSIRNLFQNLDIASDLGQGRVTEALSNLTEFIAVHSKTMDESHVGQIFKEIVNFFPKRGMIGLQALFAVRDAHLHGYVLLQERAVIEVVWKTLQIR